MATRLVLCYPLGTRHYQQICAAARGAEVVNAGQERVAQELLDCDLFCGHAKVPVDWDEVVRRGRLRWIQSSAAGLDHCLVPSVIESPIVITSASGLLADQVAEQTLALLLGLLRSLPTFFRAQRKREYLRRPTHDLHRSTVGIVGLGGNGRRIAQVLAAFHTRILATDYFPYQKPPEVESLWPADRLDELLRQVEVLILTPPLNDQTRHLIDARRLALLRPGAVLINVARGPIVDEAALVDALSSGHLLGAGVDVAEVEPLPADSPLWDQPNVLITPHVGGQSRWRADQVTDFLCENLARYWDGRPLLKLIDKRLGFPIRQPD